MTPSLRHLWATAALAAAALASPAAGQTSSPPPATDAQAKAADSEPVNDQAAQDRIMTMVRAGKCGPAKAEATRVGDLSLADQIATMCGARSADPFAKRQGGGRRGKPGG